MTVFNNLLSELIVGNDNKDDDGNDGDSDGDEDGDDKTVDEPCNCNISLILSIGAVAVRETAPDIAPAKAFLRAWFILLKIVPLVLVAVAVAFVSNFTSASLWLIVWIVVVEDWFDDGDANDGLVTITTVAASRHRDDLISNSPHSGRGRFILCDF